MASNDTPPLCPDWVFQNNANVHVAKDRGWFKTYTHFPSKIDASPFITIDPSSQYLPVLGIGTVEIPTKRSPNTSGVASHGSLLLHEVLHVPDSLCNFIGQPLITTGGCDVIMGGSGVKSKGNIKDSTGKNVAYFDPKSPLFGIKVRCPPNARLGPHALKKDVVYMLGVRWDAAERRKWLDFNGVFSATAKTDTSYTAEEMAFLKKNYGSEFKFLLQHGLKITDEEDREEGRAILRAVMHDDDNTSEDVNEEEDEDEFAQFEGHLADYNFTKPQLEWIEKHYRNSEQFMMSYGLKFYDTEDLEEAKVIVEAMMDDSD